MKRREKECITTLYECMSMNQPMEPTPNIYYVTALATTLTYVQVSVMVMVTHHSHHMSWSSRFSLDGMIARSSMVPLWTNQGTLMLGQPNHSKVFSIISLAEMPSPNSERPSDALLTMTRSSCCETSLGRLPLSKPPDSGPRGTCGLDDSNVGALSFLPRPAALVWTLWSSLWCDALAVVDINMWDCDSNWESTLAPPPPLTDPFRILLGDEGLDRNTANLRLAFVLGVTALDDRSFPALPMSTIQSGRLAAGVRATEQLYFVQPKTAMERHTNTLNHEKLNCVTVQNKWFMQSITRIPRPKFSSAHTHTTQKDFMIFQKCLFLGAVHTHMTRYVSQRAHSEWHWLDSNFLLSLKSYWFPALQLHLLDCSTKFLLSAEHLEMIRGTIEELFALRYKCNVLAHLHWFKVVWFHQCNCCKKNAAATAATTK